MTVLKSSSKKCGGGAGVTIAGHDPVTSRVLVFHQPKLPFRGIRPQNRPFWVLLRQSQRMLMVQSFPNHMLELLNGFSTRDLWDLSQLAVLILLLVWF